MYYVQYKNEKMHETVELSDGFSALSTARQVTQELKDEGAPVWRIIKVKTDRQYNLHLVSVHKLTR